MDEAHRLLGFCIKNEISLKKTHQTVGGRSYRFGLVCLLFFAILLCRGDIHVVADLTHDAVFDDHVVDHIGKATS